MDFASRFLYAPGVFPGKEDREPWGEATVVLDFVGGPYIVEGLSQQQAVALRQRFAPLCTNPTGSEGPRIRIYRIAPDWFRRLDGLNFELDFDYHTDYVRLAGWSAVAWIDIYSQTNAQLWVADDADLVEDRIFENLFRPLVAYRLLSCGGLLLHSSGVVLGQGAYVFFGHSGAGKTTVATLALGQGHEVLSDDLNALMRDSGGFQVAKLPFAGVLGQTAASKNIYPLSKLYSLRKAADVTLTRLEPSAAAAAILSCCPFVNMDSHRFRTLADRIEKIVGQVSVMRLEFTKEFSLADTLSGSYQFHVGASTP